MLVDNEILVYHLHKPIVDISNQAKMKYAITKNAIYILTKDVTNKFFFIHQVELKMKENSFLFLFCMLLATPMIIQSISNRHGHMVWYTGNSRQ